MFGKYVWRVLIVGALIALAVVNSAKASNFLTHGPNFNASFNPSNNAQVGQDVNIHIKVNSTNPGATRISVGCGGVSKAETSEVEFDSIWHTSNCGAGSTSISICTKAPDDPNWQDPNCNNFRYLLLANNSSTKSQSQPQPQGPSQPGTSNRSISGVFPELTGLWKGQTIVDGTLIGSICIQMKVPLSMSMFWSEPDKNSQIVGNYHTLFKFCLDNDAYKNNLTTASALSLWHL